MMENNLECVISLLLNAGYRVICNGCKVGTLEDLNTCLLDGEGGELVLRSEEKLAIITQHGETANK